MWAPDSLSVSEHNVLILPQYRRALPSNTDSTQPPPTASAINLTMCLIYARRPTATTTTTTTTTNPTSGSSQHPLCIIL